MADLSLFTTARASQAAAYLMKDHRLFQYILKSHLWSQAARSCMYGAGTPD